ncbi:YfhO family protein [Clostridium sp. AT4]|uniref:YfhO family protein n=1 Tax=Clostridium sp. AT4 TaxID=1720194 RepID=UPI0008366491|nr:YfhO family protein [Clostridium sp. AT4]
MKREEIVQAERELDAVLELIQESEEISGRDDIKEERMKERNRIQEAEAEESLTRINMEDTADMLQYEACRELKRCRDVHILRPGDSLLAAFFVPVLVLVVIFAQRGIFPFGEECFLRTDMYHQYAPFFSEFQYKLTHGGSLLYSWDIGMGVNFSALYAYYLASPMNWLVALCPRQFLIEFMTVLIVIKTGLSGLSFTWYLRKHTGTREFGSCFFGIFYALSGYMAAYSWNIMWLDCILLFPVILFGLERLVKEKKGMVYCIALGLSILSNYYISIMICIFMVIYAAVLVILYPPKKGKEFAATAGRFTLYSLLAGGLAAVVLLPEIYALQATASGNFDFPKTVSSYFSIFDMIARHMGNVQTEIGLDHWPNIYCGVAVLMLLLLYLGNKNIKIKEKAVYFSLLLFFYASFSVNVLNFIWHGFHYPNSLPCRQSFIYIALVLVMCYKAYLELKNTPWKHIVMAFWGAAAFVILAEKLVDNEEQFHFAVFYAAILFLALYTGCIYLYHSRKWCRDGVLLAVLGLVFCESAVNMAVTSIPTTSRTAYVKDNEDTMLLADSIRSSVFYRIEKGESRTKNDGAWMNFPSASLFSSVASAAMSDFFKSVGCESSTNAYSVKGSTPFIDALFAARYGIYPDQQPADSLKEQIGRQGSMWLYENKHTLPVGFVMPQDMETNWVLDSGNPANVQNDLSSVLGVSNLLVPAEGVSEGKKFTFTADASGDYYVYVTNKKVEEVSAEIGERSLSFDNVDRGYFLELGYLPKGQEVILQSKTDGNPAMQAEIWRFDPEAMEEIYQCLSQSPLELSSWTDTGLAGSINTPEGGTMFTSIPYDKGWKIWVDGTAVSGRPVFDAFLGVDLEPGEHKIRLSYEPQGLKTGAVITGVSVAAVAALAVCGWMKNKKKFLK